MGFGLEYTVELTTMECGGCGTSFALSTSLYRKRQRDHETFYCPRGCARHFPGKSDVEKLEEQVNALKEDVGYWQDRSEENWKRSERAENRRRAQKAATTRLKNRVKKGVCPCCNRAFENLARHMETKHPDYGGE